MLEKFESVLKSTLARVIIRGILLLVFPAILFFCLQMTEVYFPGFGTEFIAIIISAAILLLMVDYLQNVTNENNNQIELIALFFIASVSGMLGRLVNSYNQDQNELTSFILVLAGGLILFGLVAVIVTFLNRGWGGYENRLYLCFGKMIAVITVIGMLTEMYLNFGTQYIWVLALGLSVFVLFFLLVQEIFGNHEYRKVYSFLVSLIPFVIALISTLYQFWFYEIIAGRPLWQALLWVVCGIGFLVFVFYQIGLEGEKRKKELAVEKAAELLAKQKVEKEEREAKQKETEEKERVDAEVKKKKYYEERKFWEAKIKELEEKSTLTWKEILYVYKPYTGDIYNFHIFCSKVHTALLKDLIQVSEIKSKMVYGADLCDALAFINALIEVSYKDGELQNLIKQVEEFIAYVEQYPSFVGYNRIMSEIKSHTAIYELISVKEKA